MTACGWDVLACEGCSPYDALAPEMRAEVDAWAVNRLWEWTNQRFGPCPVTVKPESLGPCCWLGADPRTYCASSRELTLPGPIAEPLEVRIDGVPVDLEDLEVWDWNVLTSTGDFRFTTRNWEVDYLLGEAVPPGGGIVAGILACEYAKSLCGDSSCRLPKRVSSIQRQGVVVGILDNFTNLSEGFTGIWEVDDWIMSATKPKRRSYATSPDVARPRILTWQYADS